MGQSVSLLPSVFAAAPPRCNLVPAMPTPARPFRLLAALVALLGGLSLLIVQSAAEGPPARQAVVLSLADAVSPATADYLIRGIEDAAEDGAALVIIRMDTPGGLVTSTRDIVNAILASPVPVAVHVAPSGARAASAGTFITYAAHVAAMAPATTIGAATPVSMGGSPFGDEPAGERERQDEAEPGTNAGNGSGNGNGDEPAPQPRRTPSGPGAGSAAEAKAINDAVAWIRGLAELRERNADWAERAVRDAATLTAREAAEQDVIDFIARTTDDLLAAAHGLIVEIDGEPVVLDTEGLEIVERAPDWRTQLLSIIANPNVAILLMLVGFYGIIFEILNPGPLFPGNIGGISMLMGMMALSILPFNWAGLALIALGLALVVGEAFSPSFGILGIGGTVAIVMGGVLLFDGDVPGMAVHWPALAAVAAASLLFSFLVARLAAVAHRRRVTTGQEQMIGLTARVTDWQGGTGHVFVHGERWQARGDPALTLQPDSAVTVAGMDGLTLIVTPADTSSTETATSQP